MKRFLQGVTMFFLVAIAGQALAQGPAATNEMKMLHGKALATQAGSQCFTSGANITFLKVCITPNGNVSWFESPAGYVHLTGREGYAVCTQESGNVVHHGFDVNIASDGWGPATITQKNGPGTLPMTITRQTDDGAVQLRQTFSFNPAERGIDLTMNLKNTSGYPMPDVTLTRYFDADISGMSINEFRQTDDASVLAWVYNGSRELGMILTSAPDPTIYSLTSVIRWSDWNPWGAGAQTARGCDNSTNIGGGTGDSVGQMNSEMTLAAGQSRNITLHYRRF